MFYTLLNKKKSYLYQLWEDEKFEVVLPDAECKYANIKDGILTSIKGYAWDGSSIPFKKYYRWLWNADKYCKIPSLGHDSLCQLIAEGALDKKYKEYVDDCYRRWCLKTEMKKWEAEERYKWLRRFKNAGIKRKKVSEVQVFEVNYASN